jgi:hypothetical protein
MERLNGNVGRQRCTKLKVIIHYNDGTKLEIEILKDNPDITNYAKAIEKMIWPYTGSKT